MNKIKVGRTHFQKVRPKEKQCAMTGALFFEKCARGNFSAPFAQWRSPNASLEYHNIPVAYRQKITGLIYVTGHEKPSRYTCSKCDNIKYQRNAAKILKNISALHHVFLGNVPHDTCSPTGFTLFPINIKNQICKGQTT